MPEAVDVDSVRALEALAEARTKGTSGTEPQQPPTAGSALEYLATPEVDGGPKKSVLRLPRAAAAHRRAGDVKVEHSGASSSAPGRFLRGMLALLLMSMGLVLVGLSTATVILLSVRETPAGPGDIADPLAQLGPPLVMLACPLALLLLAGAWLLRLESRQRTSGPKDRRPSGLK